MGKTLLKKVWDLHTVRQLPTGQTQLFIGLHLVHEVTSPQAFDTLRANGWTVPFLDRTFATVDHIVPTRRAQPAVPRRDGRGHDGLARAQRARLRRPLRRPRRHPAGHRPRDRPRARAHAARDDDRLRRQPHLHARRVRLGGVRHRHVAGARRAGVAVPGARAAEGAADPRHRHAAEGRLRQGRDPRDHPAARRAGRQRLRLRIRRRRRRSHVDGRADDDLQHVDRGRRARRLREPRRHDLRVPAGPAVRAAGRASSTAWRRGGSRWRRTPTRPTTTTWRSRPRS